METKTTKTNAMENFDPILYIHRYACWTAARAVQNPQTSGYTTNLVCKALNDIKIIKFLSSPDSLSDYSKIHSKLVKELQIALNKSEAATEFGISAKIVAIYFKTALMIPALAVNKPLEPFLMSIYPPIDSNVLQGLRIRDIHWTNMTKEEHITVIQRMLELNGSEIKQKGFWIMDRFFNPGA